LLAFDLSDTQARLPEPQSANRIAKDGAVVLMTLLISEKVHLTVRDDDLEGQGPDAMKELSAEMNWEVSTVSRCAQSAKMSKTR
jgi:hypothetical protein